MIIFDSVSRMSGNADDGFSAYQELYSRGVSLVFLKEPHINTDTYKKALQNNVQLTGSNVDYILEGVSKYLMALAQEQIRLAFEQSEKEVEDLHQRTREGIETARLNGKQIGQRKGAKLTTKKSVAAKEIIRKHSQDFNGTLNDMEVMQLTGLARNTYYKYKRELREAELYTELAGAVKPPLFLYEQVCYICCKFLCSIFSEIIKTAPFVLFVNLPKICCFFVILLRDCFIML